jgi:hypothetical protein
VTQGDDFCMLSPMWWDIAIGIGLGALTVVTMVLGGHLASKKSVHRWTFHISGVLMLGLIGVQTYRTAVAQRALEKTLSKIEKNTQQHSRVIFEIPSGRRGVPVPIPFLNPMGSFRKDDDMSLNVSYANAGDYVVQHSLMGAEIVVSPIAEHKDVFARMHKTPMLIVSTQTVPPHIDNGVYFTFPGPKLTKEQAQKLNSGDDELCVLGLVFWEDDTGKYETDCDTCFSKAGRNFNWHLGPEHNKETRR